MLCLEDMGELDYLSTHRYGQCLTSAARQITYMDRYITTVITSLFFIMLLLLDEDEGGTGGVGFAILNIDVTHSEQFRLQPFLIHYEFRVIQEEEVKSGLERETGNLGFDNHFRSDLQFQRTSRVQARCRKPASQVH